MLTKLRLAGTINCGAILRHVILDATLAILFPFTLTEKYPDGNFIQPQFMTERID